MDISVYDNIHNKKSKYGYFREVNEDLILIIYGYIIQYADIEVLISVLNTIYDSNITYDPKILLVNIDITKKEVYKSLLDVSYSYDDVKLYKYLYKYFDEYKTPINKKCPKIILHHFLLSDDYSLLRNCISDDYLSYDHLYNFNIISDKFILSRVLYLAKSISQIENILFTYSDFFIEGESFNIHTKYFNLIHFIKKHGIMLFSQII